MLKGVSDFISTITQGKSEIFLETIISKQVMSPETDLPILKAYNTTNVWIITVSTIAIGLLVLFFEISKSMQRQSKRILIRRRFRKVRPSTARDGNPLVHSKIAFVEKAIVCKFVTNPLTVDGTVVH